ncbi:PAS domain-containing sensor histidine kinase [Nitrobacter sp.]|uniref:hybrid sensor histidine kinase/response regulator n=1 Tax=Nitrobacter sp. TaxID=29420 RepID=UPI0029CAC170|nr:PAS domain-containing protein [Nitrobacter sp.]
MLEKAGNSSRAFLAGGGEVGDLTRRFDWAATSVGAPETWPQSLRTAVCIILNSSHPMFIWWGPDLIQFYNDACRQTMGPEQHPRALGRKGRECWVESWDIIGPQIEHVMAGRGATWHEDQLVPVTRHGRLEQVYWTYGFSPIHDERGVGGVLAVCRDVTREHLAKIALQERETELARVQAIGRIGGLEVDLRTGHRSRKSPEYLKIHGLPPEAVHENHEDWLRRVHPDDRAVAEGQFIDAVRGGDREYAVRYRIIRPNDGETRWISARSVIERDADGNAVRLFGAHIDVTDQVEAERAIRQREEEFRTLAEALPHHVWTATPNGSFNWFNPRVYDYVGARPGEFGAKHWDKVVHPDDASAALAAWTRAVSSGEPYEIEFRLRRADGSYRWFLTRAVPARDEDGRITRWIGTNTDVHDQKRIAGELAELNATLADRVEKKTRERDRIWNVSQDLLLVTDHDGIWRSVNPAWTRTLGWSEDELLERTAEWIEHPEDIVKTRVEVRRLARGKATMRFENRLRHKNGTYRWLSWTAVPDQDLIYAVARDVTAEKAAAERLRAAEDALRQSQKMEAVGQLTGGIAHDFNNLLTGIVGSMDLMRTRLGQGRTDSVGRYIEAAMASANRAAALTHRLLAFARRQPLVPKPVDANQLILSLEDLLRRSIGETINLQILSSERLWPTLCDPNQLESALLNLAINARDAMPGGGKLTIATANTTVRADDTGSSAMPPGDYVCISVADTGTGMTADVAERAFDPFFTTKPIGQGTGLGLSMIYGFIRQSNGHISLDTMPGRGTSIRLYLPRHNGVPEVDQVPVNRDRISATGETVLVVEDEPVVRGIIVEMLHDQGYRTREAPDGAAGLRILQLDKPVDLLLTDIGLPGMNGRQLADQARKLRPNLKILFMTGYAENAANAEGFLQPGMDMITKPFDLGHLSQRVRDIISS